MASTTISLHREHNISPLPFHELLVKSLIAQLEAVSVRLKIGYTCSVSLEYEPTLISSPLCYSNRVPVQSVSVHSEWSSWFSKCLHSTRGWKPESAGQRDHREPGWNCYR